MFVLLIFIMNFKLFSKDFKSKEKDKKYLKTIVELENIIFEIKAFSQKLKFKNNKIFYNSENFNIIYNFDSFQKIKLSKFKFRVFKYNLNKSNKFEIFYHKKDFNNYGLYFNFLALNSPKNLKFRIFSKNNSLINFFSRFKIIKNFNKTNKLKTSYNLSYFPLLNNKVRTSGKACYLIKRKNCGISLSLLFFDRFIFDMYLKSYPFKFIAKNILNIQTGHLKHNLKIMFAYSFFELSLNFNKTFRLEIKLQN